jgi:outer membrane protein assembly factor BamB
MQTESTVLPPSIVLSATTVYATQGSIYTLEASSGILQQHYQIQGFAYSTVMDDVIYVNANHLSNHMIRALHVRDGSSLWSFQVERYLPSAPVIAGDVVYASSVDTVYALRTQDGSLLWHFETGPMLFASPTVVDEVVFVSPDVNHPSTPFAYALHAKNGTLLWRSQISDSTSYPLAVVDGVVYISSHRKCSSLRASDGSVLWQHETKAHVCSPPIVVNGMVYIGFSPFKQDLSPGQVKLQQEAVICALRASDGFLLWTQQFGDGKGAGNLTSSVFTDGAILIGADDGSLSAFRASDGVPLWRYKTGGLLLSSPAAANGVVYVGANDGSVYALRTSDGALLWQTFVSTEVTAKTSIGIRYLP